MQRNADMGAQPCSVHRASERVCESALYIKLQSAGRPVPALLPDLSFCRET